MFDYEQHKIDRAVAAEAAGRRGARPHLDASHAAIFTFMGVFFGLEFFAVVSTNELDKVGYVIIAFAAVAASVAYWTTRTRENRWVDRFHQELDAIEKRRA